VIYCVEKCGDSFNGRPRVTIIMGQKLIFISSMATLDDRLVSIYHINVDPNVIADYITEYD